MILVIGATGYIGRYFCTMMKERGIEVLALGRSEKVQQFFKENKVPFQYFDITKKESFESLPKENVEAIVDLSACLAELETPIEKFFEINTVGVAKVLEYAYRNGIKKVVIASSHKLYNGVNKEILSEDDAGKFGGDHTPYIISKLAAEKFVEWYNEEFDMNAVALRFTGVHGYGELLGFLEEDGTYKKSTFELFFEKALKGEDIEVWGNQSVKRDHIYIKDVINAIYMSTITEKARGIYNIAMGVGYSQLDEANALAEVFAPNEGVKSRVKCYPEKPGLLRGYVYDISKAEREFGWKPDYTDLVSVFSDYKKEWETKKYHNYHYIKKGQEPATI